MHKERSRLRNRAKGAASVQFLKNDMAMGRVADLIAKSFARQIPERPRGVLVGVPGTTVATVSEKKKRVARGVAPMKPPQMVPRMGVLDLAEAPFGSRRADGPGGQLFAQFPDLKLF